MESGCGGKTRPPLLHHRKVRVSFRFSGQSLRHPRTLDPKDRMERDQLLQKSRSAIVGGIGSHRFDQSPGGTRQIALTVQTDSQIAVTARAGPVDLDRLAAVFFTLIEARKRV